LTVLSIAALVGNALLIAEALGLVVLRVLAIAWSWQLPVFRLP
jgi:uncharacterized membrane protein YeiH